MKSGPRIKVDNIWFTVQKETTFDSNASVMTAMVKPLSGLTKQVLLKHKLLLSVLNLVTKVILTV